MIRAGALASVLGDALPSRDLIVTADHGMVLPGANGAPIVVNASALVGAPGITFLDWRALGADFSYYHIETEGHETVLAEGAPAETYIDYVGRRSFDNYADYEARFGDERIITEMPAPRVSSARLLPEHVRTRLGIGDSGERNEHAALERAA